jgi:malonyl-CoA decarboxylase
MPGEPLIFVEVALVNGMAGNIQELLDETAPHCAPELADTAIFYSISNAQAGLGGISFGNFLIKRVVDELIRENKGIKAFATLSPIPGFMEWLGGRLAADDQTLVSASDARLLAAVSGEETGTAALRGLLDGPWWSDPAAAPALERPLMRLCARYLMSAKRDDRALDPVARFHLTNGARIERLNWLGDTSEKGLRQSAGMMVNYLYRLDEIDGNHEGYTGEGRITASAGVRSLARAHLSALTAAD